jgi:hypothetical protein
MIFINMIKQTWNISDNEKLRILNLHESATKNHYLINEQQMIRVGEKNTTTSKEISLSNKSYPAGYYSIEKLDDGKKDLDSKLQEIAQFAKENDGTNVNIQIEVGESKVTNRDNELNQPLKQGELARLRGDKLQEYLIKYFEGLVKSGYLTTIPNIPTAKTNVELGTQKHDYVKGTDDPKDPKYLEDQYVKFNITLSATKTENVYECLVNLTIDVSYYNTKNSKFPCRGGHECNKALFEVYLNSVLLGVADLNNLGCASKLSENPNACDRTAKFIVTDEMVKKIMSNPKWNKKTLILSTKCLSSYCHTSVQEVKIVNGDGNVIYHNCVNPQSARGNTSQKILAVLDKCGKPIEGTVDDSVSAEEMVALSDEVTTSSNKRVSEIINSVGLVPLSGVPDLIYLLSPSSKEYEITDISSDNEALTVTVKFISSISGRFANPLGGEDMYQHTFKSGETGKVRYSIKNINIPQRKLDNLVKDGQNLFKIPNFNGYFITWPIKLGGVKYPVNTVLVNTNEQ